MARGGQIEIPIAVDTSGTEKAIQNGLIDPAEDAHDALEKLAKADTGDLAGEMKKVQRATDDAKDELDDTRDSLKKLGYAAKDVGDDGAKGLGKIKGASQEVTQEMGQNLGEAVSSIRGDMSDLGQVGQDTLGGLAATLAGAGPAGLVGAAALAAGAVGLGLVTAELQAQQKEADALKERMSDAYRSAVEAGNDYIDQAAVVANWNDLIFNTDRASEYQKVQDTQKATGLEWSTIMKANAGDLDALAIVRARVTEEDRKATEQGEEANLFLDAQGTHLQKIRDYWNTAGEAAETNSEKSKVSIQSITDYWLDQIQAAGDVAQRVDDVGNKIVTLPSGVEVLIDAKTGQATDDVSRFGTDTDQVIDHLNGREVSLQAENQAAKDKVSDFARHANSVLDQIAGRVVSPTVRVTLDTSKWDNWRPQSKEGTVVSSFIGSQRWQ